MNAYDPDWESLQRYQVPAWFRDAKLGIFIHWGPASVPAFENEWYPRHMYVEGTPVFEHHRATWGDQSEFGYKDFIPRFKAEAWDPEAWVDLFREAGARYIVPVAEHHDGFPMYDCSFTNWNAARMGPRRDTVADLGRAVRGAGLKFGVSSHRAFNWHFFTFRDKYDTSDSTFHKLYGVPHSDDAPLSHEFVLDWYARTREMIDRFHPDILWFDFGWHRDEFKPWRPRLTAYYYNHALENGYEPVLQYKDKIPDGVAVLDVERGKLNDIRPAPWQTDTSVSYRSWCYVENNDFRTVSSVIHDLVDIVSKNGNLLLNVGPRPDGIIPDAAQAVLRGLGRWLSVNGEAIYGTRPWKTFGEGPTGVPKAFHEKEQAPYTAEDIRFTRTEGSVFAICLGIPQRRLTIRSLGLAAEDAERVTAVSLVGSEEPVTWSQDAEGLHVDPPAITPCDHAMALRIS